MITASSLIALVEARGAKEATGQLLEVGAASDTAGTRMKAMAAGGLLVAGAALVGIGVESVKMAGSFQAATNLLITSAGEIPQNIDLIRKGLLRMSVDTATPVDELTKGMFNIESAGYHGAAALKVEAAAAEGAKVENADLASVTDVLTTAMHNYNLPASQAVDVMNSFRLSASIGKMRMDDLTGALRNVLPIASQAGVKLSDVEAALSTMSLAGDKGASAGTHLAQMFTYLLAPSSKARSALREVGLTTQEISDEMKVSLPGTIQMITDAVGQKFPVGSAKYIAALSAIVGGNKSMKAMLELSGISLKTFIQDASQLGPTMKANSTAVDGWNVALSNNNFKMQAAQDAVSALMITLGTKLLPIVGQVADAVTPLVKNFTDWVSGSDKVCTSMDRLTGFVMIMAKDVKTFVTGIADAANKSGLFQAALQAAKDILPGVAAFLIQAGDAINTNLLPPLESLITNVGSVAAGFIDWADKSGVAKTTLDTLGGAVQLTTQILGPLIQAVSDVVGWLGGGGAGTDTLVFTLSAAATAFTLLKIADTTAQFGSFISKLQEGDGIISNLASSVKDKLARAFDDFLSNQAPHLKASMDSVKVSAEEAAVAEEEVAAAPVDESAAGWFARLETSLGEVETTAASTGVAVGEIGTTAETTMAEGVATGSTESETSLAGVGVAADETKTKVASAGTTGGGAMSAMGGIIGGLVIGIAAMGNEFAFSATKGKDFVSQFQQGDWLGSIEHFIALGTPGGQLASTIDVFTQIGQKMGLVKSDAQDMDKKTAAAAAEMQRNVVASGNDMANKMLSSMELMRSGSVTDATKFSDSVMRVFNEMKTSGIQSLSDLDSSAKSYLQEIQGYVDAMNYQLYHLQADNIAGRNTKTSMIGKQGYASGTDYVPQTGRYMVGELGPEEVVLQQGSRVIPNDQIGRGGSGWGGSSKQPVHIHVDVGSRELASVLVADIMDLATRQTRLSHGRKVF